MAQILCSISFQSLFFGDYSCWLTNKYNTGRLYKSVNTENMLASCSPSAESWIQMTIAADPVNVCRASEPFLCVFQERRSGKGLTDWWSVGGFYQLICLEKTPSSWSTCAAGSCPRPQSLSLDQMSKTISCNKLFPVRSKWALSVETQTSALETRIVCGYYLREVRKVTLKRGLGFFQGSFFRRLWVGIMTGRKTVRNKTNACMQQLSLTAVYMRITVFLY